MQPDLNRLRIFYYIHSRLSITEAAEALHITPSAVSQQLKKLESEIKTPLFTRLHKRLVPTVVGKRLFTLVKPLLSELQAGIDQLEKDRTEPTGLLRIGAPTEFGSIYLPQVIASFRRKYDRVTFNLDLGRPASLMHKISSGELDFAFIDTFPTKEQYYSDFGSFSINPMIEEEVVLACSKEYNETRLSFDHTAKKLQSGSFISQQNDARALHNWFRYHFGKNRAKLNIVLTVPSHQAVVSGVRHHLGLGIIVTHIVWDEIRSGDIVVIRRSEKQAVNSISIVQLQDKIPTMIEKYFLNHFENIIKKSITFKQLNSDLLF